MHFRGPIQIKQFAYYSLIASSSNKRDVSPSKLHRHGHQHELFHQRVDKNHKAQGKHKRQEVTANIDGQVASWANNWFRTGATSSTNVLTSSLPGQWVTATIDGIVVSWVNNWLGDTSAIPAGTSLSTKNTEMVPTAINAQVSIASHRSESASHPTVIGATSVENVGRLLKFPGNGNRC
jgi:stalled ribosome alternative rescue factor ArfA